MKVQAASHGHGTNQTHRSVSQRRHDGWWREGKQEPRPKKKKKEKEKKKKERNVWAEMIGKRDNVEMGQQGSSGKKWREMVPREGKRGFFERRTGVNTLRNYK